MDAIYGWGVQQRRLRVGIDPNHPRRRGGHVRPRFDFHTSNNKEKYRSLLAELRLAKQMGEEAVMALTDSRLAANQINGSFETKGQKDGEIRQDSVMAYQIL